MLITKSSRRFKSCIALSIVVLLMVSMFTATSYALTIDTIADAVVEGTVTATIRGAALNEEVTILVYPEGKDPVKENIAYINQDTQTDSEGVKTFTFKLPAKSTAGSYVVKAGSTNTTTPAQQTMEVLSATQTIAPTVTTGGSSNIGETTATVAGSYVKGSEDVNGVGVEIVGGELDGEQYAATAVAETFSVDLTGLTADTSYTYKAYATTATATTYGGEETFTTNEAYVESTVSMGAVTNVTKISATFSGSYVANSDTVTGVGFVYSNNGSIDGGTVVSAVLADTFTVDVDELAMGTEYSVWSYIIVDGDKKYSSKGTFKTVDPDASTVTAPTVPSFDKDSATFSASYTANDYTVDECGFVYGLASVTEPGVGTTPLTATLGTPFTAIANGLTMKTEYKVWSYIVVGGVTTYSDAPATFATEGYSAQELADQFIAKVDAIAASANDVELSDKADIAAALEFYNQNDAEIASLTTEKYALLTSMNSKITFLEDVVTLSVNGKASDAVVVINPRGGNKVEFTLDAETAAKEGYTFNFNYYAEDAEVPEIGDYTAYAPYAMLDENIIVGEYYAVANILSSEGFAKTIQLAFSIVNEDPGSIEITGTNGRDIDTKFPRYVNYRGVTISLDKEFAQEGEKYCIDYKSYNDSNVEYPEASEFTSDKSKSFTFSSEENGTYYAIVYIKSADGAISMLTKKYFVIVDSVVNATIDVNGIDFASVGGFPKVPNYRAINVTVNSDATETGISYNYALRKYNESIGTPDEDGWTTSTIANLNPDANLVDGTYYAVVFVRNADTQKSGTGYDAYFVKKYIVVRNSAISGKITLDGIDTDKTGNFPRIAKDGDLKVSLSFTSNEAMTIAGDAKYYYTLAKYNESDPVPSANEADWTTDTTGVSLKSQLNALSETGTYKVIAYVRNADSQKTGSEYDTVLYRYYINVQKSSIYAYVNINDFDFTATNFYVVPNHKSINVALTLGDTSTNVLGAQYSYHVVQYNQADTSAVDWEWTTDTAKTMSLSSLVPGTYKIVVYVKDADTIKIGDDYDSKFIKGYIVVRGTNLVGKVIVNGQPDADKFEPIIKKSESGNVEISLDLSQSPAHATYDVQYKFAAVLYNDPEVKEESGWSDSPTGTIDVSGLANGTYVAYVYVKYTDYTGDNEYNGAFTKKYFLIRD